MLTRILQLVPALTLASVLTACGTDSGSGGNDAGGSGGSGFSLHLTDAAFDDAARVDITFVGVRLRKTSGDWVSIPLDPVKKIELASLQGTKTAGLLTGVDVDPGDYDELRLIVDTAAMANTLELTTGGVFDLPISSGASSGLKIKGNFTVFDTRPTSLVVDIDLRQSIIASGSGYIMRPVLRMVSGGNFGHARGILDSTLLTAPSCSDAQVGTYNALYVYAGHNVVPDDIDLSSNLDVDPITTSRIAYDASKSEYVYEAAFLPAGDYTIAFTCNSNLDKLSTDDKLQFFKIQNVTVQVNNTSFL